MFWKTIKPKFSNKTKTVDTIILTENNKIIKDERLIAETFKNYFTEF